MAAGGLAGGLAGASPGVRPETVLRWHRQGWRLYWTWKSRARLGRPHLSPEVRVLIARISKENPLWGSEPIRGELLKLGIDVSNRSIRRYRWRRLRPADHQRWRPFLTNELRGIWAADLFVVQTVSDLRHPEGQAPGAALVEGINSDQGLSAAQKQEAIESVQYLSEAANEPPEKRKRGMVNAAIAHIPNVFENRSTCRRSLECMGANHQRVPRPVARNDEG